MHREFDRVKFDTKLALVMERAQEGCSPIMSINFPQKFTDFPMVAIKTQTLLSNFRWKFIFGLIIVIVLQYSYFFNLQYVLWSTIKYCWCVLQ